MPRSRSSSGRARALLALPLSALVLAGCGTSGTGTSTNTVTATGTTLTVFISDPAAVRADPSLQDVVEAEQLAWTEQYPSVKNVSLKLKVLTDTVSQNARDAIQNSSAVAYLGEVQQGQSRDSVGITNAEDLLELSPTDSVSPVKDNFESFSSYGRTFASLPVNLTTSASALSNGYPAFAKSFSAHFHRAPSTDAIQGYDAVWTLLRVVQTLGNNANDRAKVTTGVIDTLKANQGKASVPAFTITTK